MVLETRMDRKEKCYIFILEIYTRDVDTRSFPLQVLLRHVRDVLPLEVRHEFTHFSSLATDWTRGLHSLLVDPTIPRTTRARLRSCSGKDAGLWILARPCIRAFRLAPSTFSTAMRFRLGLVHPSTSSLLICECGITLEAAEVHMIRCPFGGGKR
ncbi:hypothetical protein Mapa_011904 [Marchantia paleacea]|nr:hypothetical protein Mapa_011904 [Marchantia paleacea]